MKPPDLETRTVHAMHANDWELVAELEAEWDQLEQPTRPYLIASAALWYAQQGLRVFPLQPRLKIPHKGTRGLLEATTDPYLITIMWRRWPDSNLAIATGHLVDVIDIDGPQGAISWARMKHLPATIGVVSTPRAGGNHLYVKATGRGNKAAIFPGVDYRGMGGYVCAPPSMNEHGVRYTWRSPLNLGGINAT